MKKLGKLEIRSTRIINDEELLILRGGNDDDACPGLYCKSNSDCCKYNPDCDYGPGFPDHKICMSPG
jgi:hypothetical protein